MNTFFTNGLRTSSMVMLSFILFLSLLTPSLEASASTNDSVTEAVTETPFQDNSEIPQSVMDEIEEHIVELDLTNPEPQEITYINENGEEAKMGIEPVKIDSDTPSILLNNGTYRIWHWTILNHVEFYINVSSNKITRVFDESYVFIGVSVKSAVAKKDSDKQASYYFTFGTPVWDWGGWNGWLRGTINSSNKLVVTRK